MGLEKGVHRMVSGLRACGYLRGPGLPVVTDVNRDKGHVKLGPVVSRKMGVVRLDGVEVGASTGFLLTEAGREAVTPNPVGGGWQIALSPPGRHISLGRQL